MRWKALFDDLEAQAEALARAELDIEVRDRIRREASLVGLPDRLAAAVGAPVQAHVYGGELLRGTVLDSGPDWLLLEESGRDVLVPLSAVLQLAGDLARSAPPGAGGEVGRRLDLRWALRGLARDRSPLTVTLRDSTVLGGTLDRVGADHVELAETGPGEWRRRTAVRAVRLLPLAALALLRRADEVVRL